MMRPELTCWMGRWSRSW